LFSHRVSPFCSTAQGWFRFESLQLSLAAFCLLTVLLTAGCGSSSQAQSVPASHPTTPTASQIRVAVSPASVSLSPGAKQQFTATIQGTSNSAVVWVASAGSITPGGMFTAPASGASITVMATSVVDESQHASGSVSLLTPRALEIVTAAMNPATVNSAYQEPLAASGGTPPYKWTIEQGSLPSGMVLQAASGVVSGTASRSGKQSFTVSLTDAAAHSVTKALTLAVSSTSSSTPTGAAYDGPAELPLVYLNTLLADTPAPGATISVPAGGNLQAALNEAACGDTILLQAGATFSTNQYTFPAKDCDDQHWIIVRTSAPDTSLPAEGTRLTPCYAGVASLPGRPVFNCASPKKVVATLNYPGTGDGPVIFANGANHYRLLGLEITRGAQNGQSVAALIGPETAGSMSQIVLDRLYIHGSPTEETRRGVDFSGGASMAVQDSYISEMHCNAGKSGTCMDSQAVSGGNGNWPMGPYKIDDNYLEAAGENILLGGGAATHTPADIEIRFNHFFKPMFWMEGQPGFSAPAFIVKNHFELKNAQRVLFDSNLLEDTWGGFTQHGDSILLTPKNQDLRGENVCPICQVTDVTIRYVEISHVAGAFVIGNGHSDSGGIPLAGERYSIHDVIVEDINGTEFNGHGTFAQISTLAEPLLQDVAIAHITAFPERVMFSVGAPDSTQIPGFSFTDSIVAAGTSPVTSTGGGTGNCAHQQLPLKTISQCFAGYNFSNNAILASPLSPAEWPAGNSFYSVAQIGFLSYGNGISGNYNLSPSSPAVGAGTGGTNLGANVGEVLGAINGIQ
jgi:hypothetical protein